jgi:chemotaxis protein histidine kinase CheA
MTANSEAIDTSIDDRLAELQREYIAELPGKVAEVAGEWSIFLNNGMTQDQLSRFYRAIHSIAGTTGMLNIVKVNLLTKDIQTLVNPLRDNDEPDTKVINEICGKLIELKILASSNSITALPINLNG